MTNDDTLYCIWNVLNWYDVYETSERNPPKFHAKKKKNRNENKLLIKALCLYCLALDITLMDESSAEFRLFVCLLLKLAGVDVVRLVVWSMKKKFNSKNNKLIACRCAIILFLFFFFGFRLTENW